MKYKQAMFKVSFVEAAVTGQLPWDSLLQNAMMDARFRLIVVPGIQEEQGKYYPGRERA